jgi:hypothetical protein
MPTREESLSSLKDLDSVRVAVDEPLPAGLSRDTIKTSIESQLRAQQIRVQGLGEFPTGDPHLRVTISASAPRNDLVALDVQIDFVQIVFMRRNPAVTFNRAQTWKADAQVQIVAVGQLASAVQGELTRQVDQFVADYRTANA